MQGRRKQRREKRLTVDGFEGYSGIVDATSERRPHAQILRSHGQAFARKKLLSSRYADPSFKAADRRMLMK